MGPSVLNVIRGNEYFRRSATDGRTCALTYSVLKNLHNRAANEYVTRNNEQEELPPLACTYFPEPDLRDLLAIADEDGMVHLLQTGQSDVRLSLKSSWQAHENAIFDVCPRPGRSHLTTASGDLSVRLWDIEQQTRVASFQGHKGSVKCVRFLPEHADVFASGSRDGSLMIWDTRCSDPQMIIPRVHCKGCGATPVRKRKLSALAMPPSSCSVTACEFRDEHYLVSCGASNGALKVWDLRKNYQLYNNDPRPAICVPYTGRSAAIHGYTSIVLDVSRRRAFASCTDHHIYQYDLLARETSEPLAVYSGHSTHSFYVKLGLSSDGRFLASGSSDASAYIWNVDTPGFPQLRLSGHRAEVAVLAWDPFHPARLATCGDDNRVLLWDATAAEEAGGAMKDCTRAEVFAAAECTATLTGASPSSARLVPPRHSAGSARTPTRTSSSMADWFTPPTKRRLTSAASNTPGSSEHSTRSESVATSSGGKSPSPPADTILSPRKKADSAANVPQRRLLPRLNALEDDIKKDDGATDVTTCDLENIPLQVQETPPRPVAPDATPSPPSASHSRKQHKIMARLFKRQASPAVDKRKSKAKRALLSTQQQITSFFKR